MFEKINTAVDKFKNMMSGAVARKIKNLEFLFALQVENRRVLSNRLEQLERKIKVFGACQRGHADDWNILERRIVTIENGHLEQIKHDMRKFNERIEKLKEWAAITSDRFETSNWEHYQDVLNRIEKLESWEKSVSLWLEPRIYPQGTIVYGSGHSGGKSFEMEARKLYEKVLNGERVLIGRCKDCKNFPKQKNEKCKKTGENVFYCPDFGCIHWEKRDLA